MSETQTEKEGAQANSFDLHKVVSRISHWLPSQGPLKDFIHHNTLHAFQDRPFHQGLEAASQLLGTHNYLPLQTYLDWFEAGKISQAAFEKIVSDHSSSPKEKMHLSQQLLQSGTDKASLIHRPRMRSHWKKTLGVDLDLVVHPQLFQLLGNYLDQGIALWRMPHANQTLWNAVAKLTSESFLPFLPFSTKYCRQLLHMTPENAIQFCLNKIVGEERLFESYLQEMLLAHPGWSGMVHMVESAPQTLAVPRPIKLIDVIAIELILEYAALSKKHIDFPPISSSPEWRNDSEVKVNSASLKPEVLWQEALEWTVYEDICKGLIANRAAPLQLPGGASAQAFFCIDDRECSLRRHLEETDPSIETFSIAGFFGLDWLFQGVDQVAPTKLCPVPVTPKYLVKETTALSVNTKKPTVLQLLHLSPSNTLFRGWAITQVLGLWHALTLAFQVFRPGSKRAVDQILSHIESSGSLNLLRENNTLNKQGLYEGYNYDEMADRVAGVLKSTGCTKHFSDLIVFVAHGASSVNNPYFAAYDCGACSGRPGAPNARAISWMANQKEVRTRLQSEGIHLPESSHVIGAMHDTTRDEVIYFDLETLPSRLQATFEAFRTTMDTSLKKNAKERCRRFQSAGKVTPELALNHVRQRGASIFEPRPELNHATNSSCIVGRRSLTRGLFLDRRAFLNSYDPMEDPSGTILNGILSAVVPVCGGINLEYYFSRMDPERYGAGTKLPHNVVGLIGVANGIQGDLLTGLPTQMTEFHDPVRLLVVVEQEPELVFKTIRGNDSVWEWVNNEWIRLACLSPHTANLYFFEKGIFNPVEIDAAIPLVSSSDNFCGPNLEWIRTHLIRGNKT